MATEQKSRDAFQPTKRYAGVGMQQGRVMLDDDFNDAERIRLEEDRRVNLDVIGPAGTPDAGFLLSNGGLANGRVDFDIAAGTFYLGGIRVWNPLTTRFQLQDDWLQQAAGDRPLAVDGRVDLAYLEVWQQPVSAVEDTELFEVALGGPDTSTRLRTMWRVRLATGLSADSCAGAWASVVAGWTAAGLGTVDATGELVLDSKLQVGFFPGSVGDLCTPSIAGGYLGAENQTIRVQLVTPTTFTWGFDNAAPLYQVDLAADRKTVTVATAVDDQAHWPVAGQVIEILPPGARLPNREKLAEEHGHLARVVSSYDPDTHQLVVNPPVPVGFGSAWTARPDAANLHGTGFFLRVWDRGDDTSSALEIPVGANVALGTTGVDVTITGAARAPGDHWIIAARPKTPTVFVPWDLEAAGGRPRHGTRRFYAPLGLMKWHADGTFELLHDCRPYFPPLTRVRGCCTYTVGDGDTSFGQFGSIQAAVNALPPEGGKVCVLPGHYREVVTIIGKHGVTIEGCGKRSLLEPPNSAPWAILAYQCEDFTVRDLAINAGTAHGVIVSSGANVTPTKLEDLDWHDAKLVRGVALEGLHIDVRGRSAIAALGVVDLTIRGCEIMAHALAAPISFGSDLGRWPSIVVFAEDVLIEDNRVLAATEMVSFGGPLVTYARTPLGGIQLGGGCARVIARENSIHNGNGDGITLGSWAWVQVTDAGNKWGWNWGISIHVNDDGCIVIDWDPVPPDDGGTWTAVSMGPVEDVTILDNRITAMGRSGIGVVRFFDLTAADQLITVERLRVERNRIEGCLRLEILATPKSYIDVAALGAICLADVVDLVVRDNDIVRNGVRHVDPICGIFALASSGVLIELNRIVDNAPHVTTTDRPRMGWRGGVVLVHAQPPSVTEELAGLGPVVRQDGQPSARVANNVIVVPEGRAVLVLGEGPMSITDNHLTVRGVGLSDLAQALASGSLADEIADAPVLGIIDLLGGIAVTVLNTGISNEILALQLLRYEALAKQDLVPRPGLDPRPPIAASGNLMFTGNQVNADLLSPPASNVLSAVNLLTFDDVACENNQIEVDRVFDAISRTVFATGLSTRITGNRIKESLLGTAATNAGLSILSFGMLMDIVAHNQTTRCILGVGHFNTVGPNHILMLAFNPKACGPISKLGQSLKDKFAPRVTHFI